MTLNRNRYKQQPTTTFMKKLDSKKKENGKIPLEKNETTIDLSITRSDQGSIINRQYFFSNERTRQ